MRIFKHRQSVFKSRMRNKAQTSFFVIAGLIMAFAALAGFFIYNNVIKSKIDEESKKAAETSLQAEEVEKFINDCVRKAGFEGLNTLSQTGGYLDTPNLISFRGTGYWHLDQVNIQPFLNQTQERLIDYLNSEVPKCLDSADVPKYGFSVQKQNPSVFIEFGNTDVTVKVNYPIRLGKEDFTKVFSEFFNTFDIRYRPIFEAATEINEKTFDADFDEKQPLKKLEYLRSLDFDVSYVNPETDVMLFTITDKKSVTSENQNYAFSFAAKLGRSELKRLTDLQNRSATNPTFLPYTIFSVDKKAQLDISSGTTVNLNGQDVPSISVQQSYPNEVVTKNIPVEKENKEIKRREDLHYVVDNPVYSFEPDGLLFNNFQRLTIYYDDPQGKNAKGVGILKGKKGFWVPIPSFEDRANRKVFAPILGLSDFSAVFCASQALKKTIARQVFEPNAGCYVQLAVTVIAIALLIYFGPVLFTAFLGGGGGFAGVGASIVGTIGYTGEVTLATLTTIGVAYTTFTALSI
ncbi:hypothetical protein HYX05_04845, partial [Candidatus Woesearchaeota archaeon]|nr:hypothetical protein [Candidatus Woesearchaeota archaeon]